MTPEELADILIGTCNPNNIDPGEALGDDTEALAAFDELAFECESCGWWCVTEELNNEGSTNLCDDCVDEGDE